MQRILPLTTLLALAVGCAGTLPEERAPQWKRWAWQRGGVVAPQNAIDSHRRVESARERLVFTQDAAPPLDAGVHILDSQSVGAYSWPDGSIFLTQGLLALMDDEELTAVIAHELGHLSGRGDHLTALAAEQLADELGCNTLASSGIPPRAMLAMLTKLDRSTSGSHTAAVRQRIATLEAQLRQREGHLSEG